MISAKLSGPPMGRFEEFRRFARQRFERAALIATDKGAAIAKSDLRSAMGEARLTVTVRPRVAGSSAVTLPGSDAASLRHGNTTVTGHSGMGPHIS